MLRTVRQHHSACKAIKLKMQSRGMKFFKRPFISSNPTPPPLSLSPLPCVSDDFTAMNSYIWLNNSLKSNRHQVWTTATFFSVSIKRLVYIKSIVYGHIQVIKVKTFYIKAYLCEKIIVVFWQCSGWEKAVGVLDKVPLWSQESF